MKRILPLPAAGLFAAALASTLTLSTRLAPLRPTVHAGELPVTYSGQVAHVLYTNCTACHHPGGAGPFSLLTYEDARRWAPQIVEVTHSHYMPPWLPEPGYGDFADNRRMSESDIALLHRWVTDGMPAGDLDRAPKAPAYSGEWQLGPPDLVLDMPASFTTPAAGTDVFRNFILPYPLGQTKYVRAMEILPAGPDRNATSAVHHANIILDRTGSYRKQHPDEWQKGVPGMELVVDAGSSFDPDSHFLFWKPDSPAIVEPPGMEWRLDPGDDLILNMHLKPTGKAEVIQAKIGLYFSSTPATRHPMLLQLEHDASIDIPAGDRAFAIDDALKLPIAVYALGVYPHAHYLGKDLEAWAILPDGRKKWLVWIKDWDIDRQSIYRYRSPILLPKGTELHMRYVYDNSTGNPRNPHIPPVRVKAGNRSEDEMGHLWLQVLPVETTVNGKDARLLLEQAWMADRLRKNPNDAMALYNMAAAANEDGKSSEAIPLYRRILAANPRDARTMTALGAAYESSGDAQHAEEMFENAIAIKPDANNARFDLADLEMGEGRYSEAEQQLRQYLQLVPADAAAHSDLGLALLRQKQAAAAEPEFRQALAIDPHEVKALRSLGELAIMRGDLTEAIHQLIDALKVQDDAGTREALAMAYAQSSRSDEAIAQLQAALKVDPKAAEAHSLLSQTYEALNRFPDAIREQQAALSLAPKDADGWNNLGVLHARTGSSAAARKDFQQALTIAPDFAAAARNLKRLEVQAPSHASTER